MNFVEFLEQRFGRKPTTPDSYGDWLGHEIGTIDGDSGQAETRLEVRSDHLSPSGSVHGGVISGLSRFQLRIGRVFHDSQGGALLDG